MTIKIIIIALLCVTLLELDKIHTHIHQDVNHNKIGMEWHKTKEQIEP